MREVSARCSIQPPSSECDAQMRQSMCDLCTRIDKDFEQLLANGTRIHMNATTAQIEDLLSSQKCLDMLKAYSTFALAICVVLVVVRCVAICFHSVSGCYGNKLRAMVLDPLNQLSTSDSEWD
eukprot:CAMPEP_0170285490 /NCGR_PEP_ID=MMETSP0116_2-20130129/42794_1 /TAXON_ID=400756 /ORGANISM="Durinskia baltica, Strain CSIRO CS-38" /LENGTH=122 /DNA_ID=CAMNT_0010536891 /DNA_START=152 /DNA_END=520 /DNA_ORIENTATION=+